MEMVAIDLTPHRRVSETYIPVVSNVYISPDVSPLEMMNSLAMSRFHQHDHYDVYDADGDTGWAEVNDRSSWLVKLRMWAGISRFHGVVIGNQILSHRHLILRM